MTLILKNRGLEVLFSKKQNYKRGNVLLEGIRSCSSLQDRDKAKNFSVVPLVYSVLHEDTSSTRFADELQLV